MKVNTHTNVTFRAIKMSVFKLLYQLTTVTSESKNLPISQIYPTNTKALNCAGLASNKITKLNELVEEDRKSESKVGEEQNDDDGTMESSVLLSFQNLGENASTKGKTSKWVELPIFYRGVLDVYFYHSSNYKTI